MKKDLLSILDLSPDELREILDDADQLKMLRNEGRPHEFLYGKALALVFEKASTRTRISFEVGMAELGGHALFLNPQDLQIGRGEEIRDTARVMSRYVSGMMIRAYKHSTIEEFARNSSVPIINGLSDIEHPCQILADIMTMREHFGSIEGLQGQLDRRWEQCLQFACAGICPCRVRDNRCFTGAVQGLGNRGEAGRSGRRDRHPAR